METEKSLQKAESLLKEFTLSTRQPEPNRLDVIIDRKDLKSAVRKLLVENHWGYLSAITGLDNAEYNVDETTREKKAVEGAGSLELLYHFAAADAILSLRVSLPYDEPNVDSICDVISSVSLYEREAAELLGINFLGTPNTDHLILPDDWPAGVYPLRKTFIGLEKNVKG